MNLVFLSSNKHVFTVASGASLSASVYLAGQVSHKWNLEIRSWYLCHDAYCHREPLVEHILELNRKDLGHMQSTCHSGCFLQTWRVLCVFACTSVKSLPHHEFIDTSFSVMFLFPDLPNLLLIMLLKEAIWYASSIVAIKPVFQTSYSSSLDDHFSFIYSYSHCSLSCFCTAYSTFVWCLMCLHLLNPRWEISPHFVPYLFKYPTQLLL